MSKLRKCVIALAITACAIVFAPYLLSVPWHLTHKSDQRVGKYMVRVPMAYFVRHTPEGISLWRMRTIPRGDLYTFGRLNLTPHDVPLDLSNWQKLAENEEHKNRGDDFSEYDSTIASTPAKCVETASAKGRLTDSLLCKAADSTTAFYVGDARGVAEAKQILTTAVVPAGGNQ
jgi:hypothetical protein